MDSLDQLTRIGEIASHLKQLERFDYDQANFGSVTLKSDTDQVGIGIISIAKESFNQEVWQAFFPVLKQIIDEYRTALAAELEESMERFSASNEDDSDETEESDG